MSAHHKGLPLFSYLLLVGLIAPASLWGETLSTSVSGIVTPNNNRDGKVVIYRIPKRLLVEGTNPGGTENGFFTLQSSIVPTSAIGVFLGVNVRTDGYLGLTAVNDLPAAPAGLEANFLQIGLSTGGYAPPTGWLYQENNIFYLPLKQGIAHTIQWMAIDRDDSVGSNFSVYCMGYIE